MATTERRSAQPNVPSSWVEVGGISDGGAMMDVALVNDGPVTLVIER